MFSQSKLFSILLPVAILVLVEFSSAATTREITNFNSREEESGRTLSRILPNLRQNFNLLFTRFMTMPENKESSIRFTNLFQAMPQMLKRMGMVQLSPTNGGPSAAGMKQQGTVPLFQQLFGRRLATPINKV